MPSDKPRMLRQQLPQPFDIIVVNGTRGLIRSPRYPFPETFQHFGGQVLPAGEPILARKDQLRVTLR